MLDHVQIPARKPVVHLYGDGEQCRFYFDFPIFDADDLWVWIDGERQIDGYTVSGINQTAGGSVVFDRPPALKCRITLHRQLTLERISDFPADAVIRAKAMNDEFDYQAACLQQVQEQLDRCLKVDITEDVRARLILPMPKAGAALGWNADGSGLTNDPTQFAETVTAVKGYAGAAKASQIAAEAAQKRAQVAQDRAAASERGAVDSATAAQADADRAHARASSAETIYAAFYPNLGPVERIRRDLLGRIVTLRHILSIFAEGTIIPPSLEAELDNLKHAIAGVGSAADFSAGLLGD